MNIMPFYELRDRLYGCAAAGCSAAAEDFRLKRAIDDMQELAQANKTFARLRDMCAGIFTGEEPALLLADCIALADALAVAQGGFQDNSETEKSSFSCEVPYNHSADWRDVSDCINNIKKNSPHLSDKDINSQDILGDPRILSAFISHLEANSTYFKDFARKMCKAYGNSLIPLLKKSIDFSNPKASGNPVEYIGDIAGTAENDWYLSLAENENAPQNVRIAAIGMLGKNPENAGRLLDFCRTEKGKLKKAALFETAKLNPPGFEDILGKMAEKYKEEYSMCFRVSSSETAVNFVRRKLDEFLENPELQENTATFWKIVKLMSCKDSIDDCFLRAAEYAYKKSKLNQTLLTFVNMVLIQNLFHNDNEKYRALITRLYEKASNKEMFYRAWSIMMFIYDTDKAINILGSRFVELNDRLMQSVFYSTEDKQYIYSAPRYEEDDLKVMEFNRIPVFESIPQSLLEIYTETNSLIPGNSSNTDIFSRVYFWNTLMQRCSDSDLPRIKQTAAKYGLAACRYSDSIDVLHLACQYSSVDNIEELKSIIEDFTIRTFPNIKLLHLLKQHELSPDPEHEKKMLMLIKKMAYDPEKQKQINSFMKSSFMNMLDSALKYYN